VVGVTNRRGAPQAPAATGPPWSSRSPLESVPGEGQRPPRRRRVRRALVGVAAAALVAAAFVMVVSVLQPGRRSPTGRPEVPAVTAPAVTTAPAGSAAPPSTTAEAGRIGRTLDQRLAATHQVERVAAVFGWIVMAATVLLIGMAVFLLVVFPAGLVERSPLEEGSLRRVAQMAVVLTIVGEIAEVLLRAAIVTEKGFVGAVDRDALLFVLVGPIAVSCLLRIAGVLLILAMLLGRFSSVKRPFTVVRGGVSVIGGVQISALASRRAATAVGIGATPRRPRPGSC
jgi:hypothetical protein